jgi:DNA-binding NarL/FixJ family response regulator
MSDAPTILASASARRLSAQPLGTPKHTTEPPPPSEQRPDASSRRPVDAPFPRSDGEVAVAATDVGYDTESRHVSLARERELAGVSSSPTPAEKADAPATHEVDLHEPVSVVLIDDHAMFRQALCRLVGKDRRVKVVGVAENGEIGVTLAQQEVPAVVVTDLRMRGMRGVDVTRKLRETLPDSPVLVLTVAEDQDDVIEALQAGACGYVVKSAVHEEIVPAILAAARGESWLSPKVAGGLIEEFRHLSAVELTEVLSQTTQLTPRERMVLAQLVKGMTNRQIGDTLGIAETTVKTHLQHILAKLQARNRLEAASLALKLGLTEHSVADSGGQTPL